MASINKKTALKTHEGATAKHINAEQQLRRNVLSCLLWENNFYEDGETAASRIVESAKNVSPETLAKLAVEARNVHNLRHVPLVLLSVLCKTGSGSSLVSETFAKVINRPDELTEFVAIHANINGVDSKKVKKVLSAQAKKGLAKAFKKFDEYSLAKYNRDGAVKLKDVLFLSHPKPYNKEQEDLWKSLIDGTIKTPETWEVALSAGGDKCEVFTRLLSEKKLGYLALLRNLRNMIESNVDIDLIKSAILDRKGAEKVLPFRFIAAARAAPRLESTLDIAMLHSIETLPKLKGKTIVLVDVSGSMNYALSSKSDMTRLDAASALASIVSSDDLQVFSFSNKLVEVPPRKGMAGVDAILRSQEHSGTDLRLALNDINNKHTYDRLIVITDEQSHTNAPDPLPDTKAYMINVANYQNGIGYGSWTHIDGFSENVIKFIYELELFLD